MPTWRWETMRAKLEFETVIRFPNLPPDLRQQALIYARAVEDQLAGKRLTGFGYVEYGFGWDSNTQSVTSVNPITTAAGDALFTGGELDDTYNVSDWAESSSTRSPTGSPLMRAATPG